MAKEYFTAKAMVSIFYDALPKMSCEEMNNYFSTLNGIADQVYHQIKQDVKEDRGISDEFPLRVTWWMSVFEKSASRIKESGIKVNPSLDKTVSELEKICKKSRKELVHFEASGKETEDHFYITKCALKEIKETVEAYAKEAEEERKKGIKPKVWDGKWSPKQKKRIKELFGPEFA